MPFLASGAKDDWDVREKKKQENAAVIYYRGNLKIRLVSVAFFLSGSREIVFCDI